MVSMAISFQGKGFGLGLGLGGVELSPVRSILVPVGISLSLFLGLVATIVAACWRFCMEVGENCGVVIMGS